MTLLNIKSHFLTLSSDDEDLLEGVNKALSFSDTSKAFVNGRFNKERIVLVKFAKLIDLDLLLPTLKIPIGFLSFIQSVLEDYPHTVVDDREALKEIEIDKIENLDGVELHEHQLGAIYTALSCYRGIIMAPTGSGKTEMFLAILNMLEQPSLVIFNRQQLIHQTFDRAVDRGLDVGLVQGPNTTEKNITLATIQSIDKIKNIKKYKNLIIDECHYVSGKAYQKVVKLAHWQRVYGFSATPVNPKKMDLKSAKIIANLGPVIYETGAKKMIDAGIIAKPKIFMVPISRPDIEDLNYKEAEDAGIIYNTYRNNIIKNIAEQHRKEGVLILNKYIEQGREINKLIPDAPFIWHEIPVAERLKIVEKFDKNEIDILIASRILDEGIDIKNFNVLIIASAGLSFVKTIQRLGRGLRITDTKKTVIVYDFIDNMNSKLEKHSKTRMRTYKMFGYDDIIKLKETDDAYLSLRLS